MVEYLVLPLPNQTNPIRVSGCMCVCLDLVAVTNARRLPSCRNDEHRALTCVCIVAVGGLLCGAVGSSKHVGHLGDASKGMAA